MKLGVFGLITGGLGLAGCIAATRLPEVSANVVVAADVRQRVLPSGLRVVHETVADSELAGVVLVIDAGAVHEPPGKEGLAHWVEHLAFRSRHREGASIERRLTASVASWNGFTSHDEVGYYAFAAKSELRELLAFAIDVMSAPLAGVSDEVYEHERRVVEAERGFRSDHAPGQVQNWIYQSVFAPGHPYARSVGGTGPSIAGLTAADAASFVAETYRPSRMTLYVFAPRDVSAESMLKEALPDELTAKAPASPKVSPKSAPPLQKAGQLVRQRAALPAPELWLTWPLPARTRQERARTEMLARVVDVGAIPRFESHPSIAGSDCALDRGQLTMLLNCRVWLNDTKDLDVTITRLLADLRKGVAADQYSLLRRVSERARSDA